MVNRILNSKNNKKILILGVALGGIIIHILNKDQYIHITGVDISDENFDLVREYSDVNRLILIKDDAETYINNTKSMYTFAVDVAVLLYRFFSR